MKFLDKLLRRIPTTTKPRKLKMPNLTSIDKITCVLPQRAEQVLDYKALDKRTVTVFIGQTTDNTEITDKVEIRKFIDILTGLEEGWYRHLFTQAHNSQVILYFFQGDNKILRLGIGYGFAFSYYYKGKIYHKSLHDKPSQLKTMLSFFDLDTDVLYIAHTVYKSDIT